MRWPTGYPFPPLCKMTRTPSTPNRHDTIGHFRSESLDLERAGVVEMDAPSVGLCHVMRLGKRIVKAHLVVSNSTDDCRSSMWVSDLKQRPSARVHTACTHWTN
jgi:hypothetical protein